jgi:hypothetical protein
MVLASGHVALLTAATWCLFLVTLCRFAHCQLDYGFEYAGSPPDAVALAAPLSSHSLLAAASALDMSPIVGLLMPGAPAAAASIQGPGAAAALAAAAGRYHVRLQCAPQTTAEELVRCWDARVGL